MTSLSLPLLVIAVQAMIAQAQKSDETLDIPDLSFLSKMTCNCEENKECIANGLMRALNLQRICEQTKCGQLMHADVEAANKKCQVTERALTTLIRLKPKFKCMINYICYSKLPADPSDPTIVDLSASFLETSMAKRMVRITEGRYSESMQKFFDCVQDECSGIISAQKIMESCNQSGYCGLDAPAIEDTIEAVKACGLRDINKEVNEVSSACNCVADELGKSRRDVCE